MEISKKELLEETGISYGQLYRWKREGLIPEEWFEKRSTFTGQETYFPKEAVLNRITMIQELKDHYSFEEMAELLTPEMNNRLFNEDDLAQFHELDVEVIAIFMDLLKKDTFNFREIVVMIALNKFYKEKELEEEILQELIQTCVSFIPQMNSLEYRMIILNVKEGYYMMLAQKESKILIDGRFVIEKEIALEELGSNLKMKYKHTFQFMKEED